MFSKGLGRNSSIWNLWEEVDAAHLSVRCQFVQPWGGGWLEDAGSEGVGRRSWVRRERKAREVGGGEGLKVCCGWRSRGSMKAGRSVGGVGESLGERGRWVVGP